MKRLGGEVLAAVLLTVVAWGCSKSGDGAVSASNPPRKPDGGPPPKMVLPETVYNFGTMDQEKTGHYTFEIRNEGTGDLELRFANTTCACTSVKLKDKTRDQYVEWRPEESKIPPQDSVLVKPGETTDLEVSWKTQFRSSIRTAVKLATNDPEQLSVDIIIEGDVVPSIELSERQIHILDVRNGKASTATFHIYSRQLDEFEITGDVDSSIPDLIDVKFDPAEEVYLQSLSAKCGYKGTIEIAPGLPIGPFAAALVIHTNSADRPELKLSVGGNVEGDIFVTPEPTVNFSYVRVGIGAIRTLLVKVRSVEHVDVKVGNVTPEFLKDHVKVVETGQKNLYQLKAEVPRGAPSGKFGGTIELETTHPTAKVVKIPVHGDVTQ